MSLCKSRSQDIPDCQQQHLFFCSQGGYLVFFYYVLPGSGSVGEIILSVRKFSGARGSFRYPSGKGGKLKFYKFKVPKVPTIYQVDRFIVKYEPSIGCVSEPGLNIVERVNRGLYQRFERFQQGDQLCSETSRIHKSVCQKECLQRNMHSVNKCSRLAIIEKQEGFSLRLQTGNMLKMLKITVKMLPKLN